MGAWERHDVNFFISAEYFECLSRGVSRSISRVAAGRELCFDRFFMPFHLISCHLFQSDTIPYHTIMYHPISFFLIHLIPSILFHPTPSHHIPHTCFRQKKLLSGLYLTTRPLPSQVASPGLGRYGGNVQRARKQRSAFLPSCASSPAAAAAAPLTRASRSHSAVMKFGRSWSDLRSILGCGR